MKTHNIMNVPASRQIIPQLHSKSLFHTTILPLVGFCSSACGLWLEFNGHEDKTFVIAIITTGSVILSEIGKYF